MKAIMAVALLCVGLLSCKGEPGTPGVSGMLLRSEAIQQGDAACSGTGGQRVFAGVDTNGNGTLDENEDAETFELCNGLRGEDGTPGSVPEDFQAVLTRLEMLEEEVERLRNPDCPPGYDRDETDETSEDIILCQSTASDEIVDEMVKVGDFWVDRYEASVWTEKDCAGETLTEDLEYDEFTFPDTGNRSAPLFACSVQGRTPSSGLTWFQAQQTCVLSGKRLCTNAEWQAAVAGTVDPLMPNNGQGNTRCNTGLVDQRVSGSAGENPGGEDSCISHFGAEDMIGNLAEWTASWVVGGHPTGENTTPPSDALFAALDPWPDTYPNDATSHIFGRTSSLDGFENGLPAALIRGGSVNESTRGGAFRVHAGIAPSGVSANIGFRCCRR